MGKFLKYRLMFCFSVKYQFPDHKRIKIPACYWCTDTTLAPHLQPTPEPTRSGSKTPLLSHRGRFRTQQYTPAACRCRAADPPWACCWDPPPYAITECGYSLRFCTEVSEHRNSYPGFQNGDIHSKTLQLASCCQPRDSRTDNDHLPSLLG